MKKVVRLTESDLVKIVKRVISEENNPNSDKEKINNLVSTEGNKVKNYYLQHFSKPETINKFKNKNNIDKIEKFIPTIKYILYSENGKTNGFVNKSKPGIINLNTYKLLVKRNGLITSNGTLLYDTILHEMSHSIDFKLQELGENTIAKSSGYYNSTGGKDDYVFSDLETYARVQRLREVLSLNPNANGEEIKKKLIEFIKLKKLTFPNVSIRDVKSPTTGLSFKYVDKTKGKLTDLWIFYGAIKINNTLVPDISALFAKFSSYKNDGSVFLNLDVIGKVNKTTKGLPDTK